MEKEIIQNHNYWEEEKSNTRKADLFNLDILKKTEPIKDGEELLGKRTRADLNKMEIEEEEDGEEEEGKKADKRSVIIGNAVNKKRGKRRGNKISQEKGRTGEQLEKREKKVKRG